MPRSEIHVCTLIRRHVRHLLLTIPAFKGRVFDSRVTALEDDETPAALIFTPSIDPGDVVQMDTGVQNAFVTLQIDIVLKNVLDGFAEGLDDLCLQVQNVMPFWQRQPFEGRFEFRGSTFAYVSEAMTPEAVATMTWHVKTDFFPAVSDPSLLRRFEGLDVAWDFTEPTKGPEPGPDGVIEMTQVLNAAPPPTP